VAIALTALYACGGSDAGVDGVVDGAPDVGWDAGSSSGASSDLIYGDTAIVVSVNPITNHKSALTIGSPEDERQGILLELDTGETVTTDERGIAMFVGVEPGVRTFSVSGETIAPGSIQVPMQAGDIRHVTVIAGMYETDSAIDRIFGRGPTAEVSPQMSTAQINEILAAGNGGVFFRPGTYPGDLVFLDVSEVIGEVEDGQRAIIDGSISLGRPDMFGMVVTGDVDVVSEVSLYHTRIHGNSDLQRTKFLVNDEFCVEPTLAWNTYAYGNAGLLPIDPPDCSYP